MQAEQFNLVLKSFSRLAYTPELALSFRFYLPHPIENKQCTAAKKITAEDTAPL